MNISQFVKMRTHNQFLKSMTKLSYTSARYPKRVYRKIKSIYVTELLKQINSLTFHVQEGEMLDKLEEILRDILQDPKLLTPHYAGLIKGSQSFVRSSQGIYRDMLRKPKLKKSTFFGRVGIGAAVTLNAETRQKDPLN